MSPVNGKSNVFWVEKPDTLAGPSDREGCRMRMSMREAEAAGMEVIGVFHSHPHTVGYPSVTDVSLAPDPTWLYVLVGMEDYSSPTVRGFRIRDGEITEERLEFEERES